MMDMSDMMQRCMDMIGGGSMMGSGMMDGNPVSWILPIVGVLLLVWVLTLVIFGAVGLWAYRRLRTH
jgi:cell division protein FtsB